jgi:hypothetical protein
MTTTLPIPNSDDRYETSTGGGKTEFPQPETIKAIPESNRAIKAVTLFMAKSLSCGWRSYISPSMSNWHFIPHF